MNEAQWRACSNVRLDQPDSSPDKQDALCMLAIFDQIDQFKQGNLTKRQLTSVAESDKTGQSVAAASHRFADHFDQVSHQVPPTSVPWLSWIGGTVYSEETRLLSKSDVSKLLHD